MPEDNSTSTQSVVWRIGDWLFEPDTKRLRRDGSEVELEPLVADLLAVMAEAPGEVLSADRLAERVWRGRPIGDSPLYRLVAVLRRTLGDDTSSPKYIETIRKRGYRLVAPVDIVRPTGESEVSPASESGGTAPGGAAGRASEQTVERRRSAAGRPWRMTAVLALVAAAAGLLLGLRVLDGTAPEDRPVADGGRPGLAVLPFRNLSEDEGDAYFSEGLTEELRTLLAEVPALRVTSRSSASSFEGTNASITTIASALNVGHVLEGSVRKSGQRIRIVAQLIDAGRDEPTWSETYDRTLDDVFAVQEDIATSVAQALRVELLGETLVLERTATEAYTLYLQARQLGRLGSREGLEQSVELLRRSLAIDPTYPRAWSNLGSVYSNLANRATWPKAETFGRAREAFQRALDIDPDYGAALAGLGWIATNYDRDFVGAAEYYRRALSADPNAHSVIGKTASLLQTIGRVDEAIALKRRSLALDPTAPYAYNNLAYALYLAGELDEAERTWSQALTYSPRYLGALAGIAEIHYLRGDHAASVAAHEQITEYSGDDWFALSGLALNFHALEHETGAIDPLPELEERFADNYSFSIARVYAQRGDRDAAFRWLARAREHRERGVVSVKLDPMLTPLHDDPRWETALGELGLSDAQVATVAFELPMEVRQAVRRSP